MFDDPNQRLKELEAALKAAEAEEEEEDWLRDVEELINEEIPDSVDLPRTKYADEVMRESDALYVEKPKRKGAAGLVFLALLELTAIGLLALRWLKWSM